MFSPSIISTGYTSKLFWQYSENDQIIVFKQMNAFGLLRAVTSIKTFFVFYEIFESYPLMIGGTEQTY